MWQPDPINIIPRPAEPVDPKLIEAMKEIALSAGPVNIVLGGTSEPKRCKMAIDDIWVMYR